MQVSRVAAQMDDVLVAWLTRPQHQVLYLYLDARYEKVRQDGHVADAAVLVAAQVDKIGRRQLPGVLVALSDQEAHWRAFLHSLAERGLSGVQLISPLPTLASRQHGRPSLAAFFGSAASFISSRTLASMYHGRR
jgi:transposase-like protein